MRNYFIFDGKASSDFGLWISGNGTYNSPKRDIDTISVKGRNGTLTIDNGRFENITIEYPAYIKNNLAGNLHSIQEHLLSAAGYRRLEDTFHPESYRMARYVDEIKVTTSQHRIAGSFTLKFDCKPQRFLKSGENIITFESNGKIFNPTGFSAAPIIRAYGSGRFSVGNRGVEIKSADGYTDIDCEAQNAYKGYVNCNGNIALREFPNLDPGENDIMLDGISKLEIIPRWWTI